jgi:AcrR family transcriptional regulator
MGSSSTARKPRPANEPAADALPKRGDASRGGEQGTASRHYRRAQRDRGADTRARLIDAALDVFGRLGFEGASTRQIAREADANLAAIVYHFGSKEALHIAVAEHIVASVRERIGPAIAAAATPEATATPASARQALTHLLSHFIDMLLGSADAERWARFIIREQLQPTAAFDVIFGFMGPAHGIGARLVATILGRPEDEEVRLRCFTVLGQVMVFRVAQTLVLRRMGWRGIGEAERASIKRIVIAQTMAILDAETAA